MSKGGMKFNRATARRIAEVTRYTEQQPRNQVQPIRRPLDTYGLVFDAVTTSSISARSGSQMGSGTFRLRAVNSTGYILPSYGPDLTGWNNTGGTVASAVECYVMVVGGLWRLIEADCSGLATSEDPPPS